MGGDYRERSNIDDFSNNFDASASRQHKAILELFIPGAKNRSDNVVPPEPGYPYSPLTPIRKWLSDEDVISRENGFDFLFVEFAPWFDAWHGRERLCQEVLLCANKDFHSEDLKTALRKYAGTLKELQTRALVLFLHPYFTGKVQPAAWGSISRSHIAQNGESSTLYREVEKNLLEKWFSETAGNFEKRDLFIKTVPTGQNYNAEVSRIPLEKLDVQTEDIEILRRIESYYGISPLSFNIAQEDFDLTLELHHRHIRRIFGLDEGGRKGRFGTTFIAAPLRMTFASAPEAGKLQSSSVPKSYRGGIWIFAGTMHDKDKNRFDKLMNLLRLSLLAGMSSVEASASESLTEGIRRHAVRTAAAAIMGRNMSHNIGSHVLARYSGKIARDLDKALGDKIDHRGEFLTYLQRRMDFLAEVATSDRAFWSEPLLLKEQINRLNYYEQENRSRPNKPIMLSYITGKESLRATVEWSKPDPLLGSIAEISQEDCWISCPGGEVGIHALFVILENIIRNSARHGSSESSFSEEVKIFVRLKDDDDPEFLKLEIIDPRTVLNDRGMLASAPHEQPLDEKFNGILSEPFINLDGTPNPRNWGLREMQLCAHYLQGLSFFDLEKEVISRRVLEAGIHKLNTEQYCLKYAIYLQRAKLMAAVVKSDLYNATDESQLNRRGICVVRWEGDWERIANKVSGYSFLVVDDGVELPKSGALERISLPARAFNLSKTQINEIIECAMKSDGIAWMESLHKHWAEYYRDKRPAWMKKPLWGVAIADKSEFACSLSEGPRNQQNDGLFRVRKSDGSNLEEHSISPLPNKVEGWLRTLEADAIGAAWVDHANPDDFGLAGASLGQAAVSRTGPLPRLWISAEAALSDSAHSTYLNVCTNMRGWEILAAAVPRIAVLDERVQSELDKTKLPGGLRLNVALPCAGIWIPPRPASSESNGCNLDKPNFEACKKWLTAPAQRKDQFPIDVLVIHLTILEALNNERYESRQVKESLQDTLSELVQNTEASSADIIIVTGRGMTAMDIDNARYLPISALLESLITRPSKLTLMRAIWSAGRPELHNDRN